MVMAGPIKEVRPTLVVNVNDDVTSAQLRELLLGVEEEGVPITLNRLAEANPLTLAHEAAIESVLDVGIGVSFGYVVVTTEKLSEEQPYMAHYLNQDQETDRLIGGNAARLVKRMPLKTIA